MVNSAWGRNGEMLNAIFSTAQCSYPRILYTSSERWHLLKGESMYAKYTYQLSQVIDLLV